MTKQGNPFATLPPMKTHRLVFVALLGNLLLSPLLAEEKSLREELRDALYTEEVTRDAAAAAVAYEALIMHYDDQKQVAASALFRLAEFRRKQGRKADAIAHYQRLLTEFPTSEAETKLAKENLTALGVALPSTAPVTANIPVDDEEKLLQRLKTLRETSPDLVNHEDLESAVGKGYFRIVEWLIKEVKVTDRDKKCLVEAAYEGNSKMTEFLIDLLGDTLKEQLPSALEAASAEGYVEVARALIKAGASVNKVDEASSVSESTKIDRLKIDHSPLIAALRNGEFEVADLLIDLGANLNSVEGEERVTPLSTLIRLDNEAMPQYLEKLITKGADIHEKINIAFRYMRNGQKSPNGRILNLLGLALNLGNSQVASILITKGAKLDDPGIFSSIVQLDEKELKVAEMLIEAGVDPNSQISDGRTLLAFAYEKNHLNLVKLLVAKGASPNVDSRVRKSDDELVLNVTQKAAIDAQPDLLAIFLKAGGKLDTKEQSSAYFLSKEWAMRANTRNAFELDCVKIFIEQGIKPEEQWRNSGYEYAPTNIKLYLDERFPADKPKAEEKPKPQSSR
jgi:ankyrin repeat protein